MFKVVQKRKWVPKYLAIRDFMVKESDPRLIAWRRGRKCRAAESLFGGTNGLQGTRAATLGVAQWKGATPSVTCRNLLARAARSPRIPFFWDNYSLFRKLLHGCGQPCRVHLAMIYIRHWIAIVTIG
jgi:hypothetical protein